ncbi:non-oxidative hydroxyarylic acid decarboxylases subunit D [Aerosticca soli]|uniref:Hydroxyaromatic non-oxidative decarboxylase protein D n=1 Tax=Aerosticca soli TaxID=2010829 RepID=A0A2Z6E3D7_9GAMM|nr:non-oxidative hydroxyarylic acid decarboxylases subunit D [Aerosticca soli]BBD79553.1 hydroxyaromatic non-oxidative decarboxylase protein D [Aerosticca soli]
MNATCPRCRKQDAAAVHQGREDGVVVWTVYHCPRCAFTWRDSEPAETIDPALRDPDFAVDPDHPEQYRYNIPPAKRHG